MENAQSLHFSVFPFRRLGVISEPKKLLFAEPTFVLRQDAANSPERKSSYPRSNAISSRVPPATVTYVPLTFWTAGPIRLPVVQPRCGSVHFFLFSHARATQTPRPGPLVFWSLRDPTQGPVRWAHSTSYTTTVANGACSITLPGSHDPRSDALVWAGPGLGWQVPR